MRQQIKIPIQIESRNKLDNMHWAEKSKLRKFYELFIRQQMSKYNIRESSVGQRWSINIVTYRRRKIRDYDNLIGGSKQLLDAMSNEGFIWDDSSEYIGSPVINQELLSTINEDEPFTIITRINGMNENNKLGRLIEDKLRLGGRKKSWLARECAVTPQTITRWIKTGIISSSKREKIKELLGVDIENR